MVLSNTWRYIVIDCCHTCLWCYEIAFYHGTVHSWVGIRKETCCSPQYEPRNLAICVISSRQPCCCLWICSVHHINSFSLLSIHCNNFQYLLYLYACQADTNLDVWRLVSSRQKFSNVCSHNAAEGRTKGSCSDADRSKTVLCSSCLPSLFVKDDFVMDVVCLSCVFSSHHNFKASPEYSSRLTPVSLVRALLSAPLHPLTTWRYTNLLLFF